MTPEPKPTVQPSVPKVKAKEDIDFMAYAKTLWGGRKTLFITLFIGAILGFTVAILTPNVFMASSIMVPQTGSNAQSSLSSLASLAGIDLGMGESSELSPIIYPRIVNSIPFKLELMNTPVTFSKYDKPITLYDYYINKKPSFIGIVKKYTVGLPAIILVAIRKKPKEITFSKGDSINQPILLTKKQFEVKKILDKSISLKVEKKEGFLVLSVLLPDALASAQIAQKAQELLQRDIIKFKIEKSQANLNFIQERYNVAKAEAEGYQLNVAANTDRFKNLTSSLPQVGSARLQTKYAIANSVFQELAKQLEQAKIQVKRDTPVFTIIEPVSVPSERSEPRRMKILVLWTFMGGLGGISIIFGKKYFLGLKEKWGKS